VEYVDAGESMDAALRALEERLGKLETHLKEIQDTTSQLVSVVNRQAKEIEQFIDSINRRVDRVYRVVSAGGALAPQAAGEEQQSFEIPPQYAQDAGHQQAWRIARVIAADLDAYYGDKVREGVLYGNLADLLKDALEQARTTYEERVPAKVTADLDYFDLAIKELVARKRRQIQQEDLAQD
jgi:septal ring factor EnvC (AmiA/AmiB activator)